MVQAGYSDNTNRVYTSAQKAYLQFCDMYKLSPVPADELQVLRFIAHLSHRISPTSIKVYLSAVRALHVNLGIKFDTSDQPRAQIMVRGLARGAPPPHQKLPITYSMLSSMITLVGQSYDDIMCWAAITVAFFGCLHADELTVDSISIKNPAKILSVHDMQTSVTPNGIKYLTLRIKSSKTCPSGFTCTIGCSGTHVCAYCSVMYYMHTRQQRNMYITNPALFVTSSGHILTHELFVSRTRSLLTGLGYDPKEYSGHSYRVGCASTAGANQFKDWEIQLLGGWRSDTFKRYIRQTQIHAVSFAARLAAGHLSPGL